MEGLDCVVFESLELLEFTERAAEESKLKALCAVKGTFPISSILSSSFESS